MVYTHVYTVPIAEVDSDFQTNVTQVKIVVRGTVYTNLVCIVPITVVARFQTNDGNYSARVIRGMAYTNCIYTVPITEVDSDLSLNVKES